MVVRVLLPRVLCSNDARSVLYERTSLTRSSHVTSRLPPFFPRAAALAVLIELLSEPAYILATIRKQYSLRVGLESAAQLVKGIVVAALLRSIVEGTETPVVFSWAQVAYAAVLFGGFAVAGMLRYFGRGETENAADTGAPCASTEAQAPRSSLPWLLTSIDGPGLWLSLLFGVQALGKFFLAEGSKLVMAAVQSDYDQGILGLVTNLGSLVVRMVFQPVEEAAFLAFSALPRGGEEEASPEGDGSSPGQRPPPERSTARLAAQLERLLPPISRSVLSVSLVAAAFAPGFAYPFIRVAYGARWAASTAPAALAGFGLSLPLLAANGVLEACVHGVADRGQLSGVNRALGATSALHLLTLLAATRALGPLGLLLADAANMAVRVAYCARFLRREYGLSAGTLLPAPRARRALALAGVVCAAARAGLLPESSLLLRILGGAGVVPWQPSMPFASRLAALVGIGVLCLAASAHVVWRSERDSLRQLRGFASRRPKLE